MIVRNIYPSSRTLDEIIVADDVKREGSVADLSRYLSRNFQLRELIQSSSAERISALKAQQEEPSDSVVRALESLTLSVLQPLRDALGYPLEITSGYRSPDLNTLVGGSSTSQHCKGEAADCHLPRSFASDPRTERVRTDIAQRVAALTGKSLVSNLDQNFFLFAAICLALDSYDIDQVIHEYGSGFGRPAWIHVSSSRAQNRRQILFVGSYTENKYVSARAVEAFAHFVN